MTYWVVARDNHNKTFMGMIAGQEANCAHYWLHVDSSYPNNIDIEDVPVICFALWADGPITTEPFWGKAKLKLRKRFWQNQYRRTVYLCLTSFNSFMAQSWSLTGVPNLTTFPSSTAFPDTFRRCLPATLLQAGQMSHIYSVKRFERKDRDKPEDGDGDPKALRNSYDYGGPGGGGQKRRVAT